MNREDLLDVDAKGVAHPVGARAVQRMRARQGTYSVLPAPAHMILMRRVEGEASGPSRRCLLAGEIAAPGTLCDVVSFIGHSGWRGELVVLDAAVSRSVFFDQGQVVGAQSTAEKERLGQVLFRYGVLDEAQVAKCAETAGTTLHFGEAAVKLGYVGREQLFGLMAKQCEEVFYGMLLVGTGTFYLLASFNDTDLAARQSLVVGTLIREGVRRMHETRYFRARIPSDLHVPVRVEGHAPPEADALGVFAQVDGRRSVADICRAIRRGEFEVSRALFQLVQAGAVAIKPPPLAPEAAVDVFNRAIVVILRELDAMDEGDPIREQLAEFALQSKPHAALFEGAGPADDGTLVAAVVARNVARIATSPAAAAEAHERLAKLLHEYASYALFLARPHLRRAEEAQARESGDGRARLSQRVSQLLEPITAPDGVPAGETPKGTT
jgi:hypothetical protein